ncbi:MAG: hypothetical protein J6B09_07785, partial [Clostridia bacterium]|nr:hypothetical protein [Clostridia bacterium]
MLLSVVSRKYRQTWADRTLAGSLLCRYAPYEDAFPVAVPEKICGLALSLIFSTAAMFAKGKLAVLGVAEDK